MTRHLRLPLLTLAVAMVLAAGVAAQKTNSATAQLRAAADKATVDGDLAGAVKQYQAIVDQFAKTDRAAAATALVRMAECYQKLGDAQALKIYERVAREFGDQTDTAALARARLAASRPAAIARMALRKVWSEDRPAIAGVRGDTQGAVSADGRFMTYIGEFNTKLFLRDLTTGTDRPLTDAIGPTYASAISKDGSAVAFNWCTMDQATCELRIATLHGAGVPPSRRVFGREDVFNVVPQDWSPDGKWIAVSVGLRDRSAQIGIVTVSDGTYRALKSVDWRGPSRMFVSPDGRDIGYDLPVSENASERDVFVIAADGSRELPVGSHSSDDLVMGWTPDGTRLLFRSDRSGSEALWAQAFADRKPQGRPELIKPDVGRVLSMGVTRTGALYVQQRANLSDIEVASFDATGARSSTPARPLKRFTGSNDQPVWSPDGKQLAYRSHSEPQIITIWDADSGQTRELRPRVAYMVGLSWAPDGSYLASSGADLKGRAGIFRIDARNGDTSPIFYKTRVENISYEGFGWSPDGKKLYYHGQRGSIIEFEIATGAERVIAAAPTLAGGPVDGRHGVISLSRDGRWIATSRTEAAGKAAVVTLLPVEGGAPRDLLRVNAPDLVDNSRMMWTPDGRAILFRKMTNANGITSELWRVPIDGSTPKKLDFDVSNVVRFSLHPDGDRVAYVTRTKSNIEVWALENFLPAKATGGQTTKK